MAPNSAIEWSFLRRRGWHTAEKLYLLRGQSPLSLTLPLAHSSPGSSPGSNGPNPLAGDWAGMPVMKIHRDLHRHFAFHRGIGDGCLCSIALPWRCYNAASRASARDS